MATPPSTPPRDSADKSVGELVFDVSERTTTLVREEIELAKAEITERMTKLARGAVIGAAASFFVVGALILLLHGFAWFAFWAIPFPNDQIFWGFWTVSAVLFLLGGLAGYLAARAFKAGSPPAPQMAIDEAKLIRETVQSPHPEQTV
jgi:putative superfamily III holin-X